MEKIKTCSWKKYRDDTPSREMTLITSLTEECGATRFSIKEALY